jgi:hypothetical protein
MRGRRTGLLLTLILLAAAIPAVLACCLHGPDRPAHTAADAPYHAAPVVRLLPPTQTPATRGCADQAGPTQTPYIETTTDGTGRTPASTRSTEAAVDSAASPTRATTHSVPSSTLAADSTGPPLWLSTCVSRT